MKQRALKPSPMQSNTTTPPSEIPPHIIQSAQREAAAEKADEKAFMDLRQAQQKFKQSQTQREEARIIASVALEQAQANREHTKKTLATLRDPGFSKLQKELAAVEAVVAKQISDAPPMPAEEKAKQSSRRTAAHARPTSRPPSIQEAHNQLIASIRAAKDEADRLRKVLAADRAEVKKQHDAQTFKTSLAARTEQKWRRTQALQALSQSAPAAEAAGATGTALAADPKKEGFEEVDISDLSPTLQAVTTVTAGASTVRRAANAMIGAAARGVVGAAGAALGALWSPSKTIFDADTDASSTPGATPGSASDGSKTRGR